MKLIILLSQARHPLSGKAVCSPNDLRALAIAQSLSESSNVELRAVHAGDPQDPVMNEYLGYGLKSIDIIATKQDEDPCPKLAGYLQQEQPQIILTGMQALGGLASGLVPYILAEQINYPLISGVISAAIEEDKLVCSQYLPKGRRRDFTLSPPTILSVHLRAASKPQFVWAKQQQGQINILEQEDSKGKASHTNLIENWDTAPAQKKRSRLSIRSNRSGFERMQRAVSLSGGGGNIIKDGSALEKAQITYNMIKQQDVYSPNK